MTRRAFPVACLHAAHTVAAIFVLSGLAGCHDNPLKQRALGMKPLQDAGDTADHAPRRDATASSGEVGDSCTDDASCASSSCSSFGVASICTRECTGPGTCPTGLTCHDNLCTPDSHCLDEDGDGYGEGPGCKGSDCDDTSEAVHPAAPELCGDDADNNCDGQTDEGFDMVGFSCTAGVGTCQRAGTLRCSEDGTELDCSAKPAPPDGETCDGLDNDCDGRVDEADACRGTPGETQSCYPGAPSTRGTGICSDGQQVARADGSWGACKGVTTPQRETCNGRDDDCNGIIDDVDADGDGFFRCSGVENHDCDDTDAAVHPETAESCNGVDDNCNGLTDEDVKTTYFVDADDDGYGVKDEQAAGCQPPEGYAAEAGDCDDDNAATHPDAPEVCNGADDNCDGAVDDGLETVTLYRDEDGDTYGAPSRRTRRTCLSDEDGDGTGETSPAGWSTNRDDCDDSKATTYPHAPELCDGALNDCSADTADWACPRPCSDATLAALQADGASEDTKLITVAPNQPFADLDGDGFDEQFTLRDGVLTLRNERHLLPHSGMNDAGNTVDETVRITIADLDKDGGLDVVFPARQDDRPNSDTLQCYSYPAGTSDDERISPR